MLDLDGSLFTQNRTVTRSSRWPSNIEGPAAGPPRPAVIAIQQKGSSSSSFSSDPQPRQAKSPSRKLRARR